jgi:hypothetical protein
MYYASGGAAHQTIPVVIRRSGDDMYAKGGLAQEARAARGAGRYGDTELVHVNKDELAKMREMWGEPTTNPETGMPEFFIGKLLKKVLPIAVSFIPGVGPVASAALQAGAGAAAGALDGGGLKGALVGAAGGALGAPGVGDKVGGMLGSTLGNVVSDPALAKSIGNAAVGGGRSLLDGGNFATGALGSTDWRKASNMMPSGELPPLGANVSAAPASPEVAPRQNIVAGDQPRPRPDPMQPKENWFSRNSIIKGIPNGLLVGGALSLLPLLFRKNDDGGDDIASRISAFQQRGYAMGGYAEGGEPHERGSFAVAGPGDGRSDDIPAQLSDGEYVFDAETVALLGNGSTKAGAKRLDDFRVNIRKHKGRKLARGEFSHDAKPPERYMRGGLY